MSPDMLDSRLSLGSDQFRRSPRGNTYAETSSYRSGYFAIRNVRVVFGRLGSLFRLSASELDIVSDGQTLEEAWGAFLGEIRKHDDAAWMTFDVGPTRPEEIHAGLDAPEDEDWAESVDISGVE